MKKRTFVFGLITGIIIAGSTSVFASDFIQASLYPVKLIINNEEQKIPEEYCILNYNGHTYVPLRFIAENLGGKVGFIQAPSYEDTKVTIDLNIPGNNQAYHLILNTDFLPAAQQGRLLGINIPLGTSRQEVIDILGEPEEAGLEHSTTPYLRYSNVTLYLHPKDDRVNVIDVQINLPADRIKELLGKPDFDGMSDDGVTKYVVGYDTEPYSVYFLYEWKEAESGIVRFKNPKQ